MAILNLPLELRVQIYSHLPDLRPGRREVVAPRLRLLPPICQVNRQIYQETVAIYARNCHFAIESYDSPVISPWTQALGDAGVAAVQSVQLSRHWKISRPRQGEGHVGFYVRVERACRRGAWMCTTGTYPYAKDTRAMRSESIELLRRVISRSLMSAERRGKAHRTHALTVGDFEFFTAAMEIVASHHIKGHAFQQADASLVQTQRMEMWSRMERQLFELETSAFAVQE
nr:hypothetical protein CFP56_59624 [Quercus suber]